MTPSQVQMLELANKQLSEFVDSVLAQSPCDMHASLTGTDHGKSVCLSGNAEGLAYFAAILLKLAKDRQNGKHMHFDANTVLDNCDYDLIIRYEER